MKEPGQDQNMLLVEQLAQQIGRWRLTLPAILFLEAAKPLSFVASQGLLLCQPLLGFLYDESRIAGYADLLAERSNVDRLIACLETQSPPRVQSGEEKEG
ncbi:MAG: hypothetical protein PVH17_07735 [Anaerolineae bacterium]|jgi:hypothetical protein